MFEKTYDENESFSYKLLLEAEAKTSDKVKMKKEKIGLVGSIKDIYKEEDKSTLFMLFTIFALFLTHNGLETLFSIYAGSSPNGVLNVSAGFAGFLFNFVAIPFILAAFPLSLLTSKIGRRTCIKLGLAIMFISLLIGFAIQTLTVTMIILVSYGIGYALINANTIVIIWELAPSTKKIGTYTGLYYFFSVLAMIFWAYMCRRIKGSFWKSIFTS